MGYWVLIGKLLDLPSTVLFFCLDLSFSSLLVLVTYTTSMTTWTRGHGHTYLELVVQLPVFIPSFHNYRIWSFLGLGMTTYTAWYMTIAALTHGQIEDVLHTASTKLVMYFTGATNILYTFGGHAVTVLLKSIV